MAEVEIHTGHGHDGDSFAQAVGVAVGIIGIILAVVTIGSHRAHTQAVIERTAENDAWSYYQAKKIREQVANIAVGLAKTLSPDQNRAQDFVDRYTKQAEKYAEETKDLEREARTTHAEVARQESRALRLDLGEGFLELGLVMSSLYFLSKRKFFPSFGVTAALIGATLGILGFLS